MSPGEQFEQAMTVECVKQQFMRLYNEVRSSVNTKLEKARQERDVNYPDGNRHRNVESCCRVH